MNWLQKICYDTTRKFFVINGQLYVFKEYHKNWLVNQFGVKDGFAHMAQQMFIRGVADFFNGGWTIGGSPQLKRYKDDIIMELNLPPEQIDTITWELDPGRYGVMNEAWLMDYFQQTGAYNLQPADVAFVQKFFPKAYEAIKSEIAA